MNWRDQIGTAALSFLFHSAVAMLATPLIGVILVGALSKFGPRYPSTTMSVVYGLAFMLLPGLISGFLVMRWMKSRPALWVWIVGIAWLAVGFADSIHFYRAQPQFYGSCSATDNIINAFLLMDSSRCRGGSEILDGIVFTFPALSAVAYSIGARIASALSAVAYSIGARIALLRRQESDSIGIA